MKFVAYISAFTIIFPTIVGLIKTRNASPAFRIIIFYFIVCLITELIASPLSLLKWNNSLIGDIFYLIEGVMLISFFYRIYNEKEFFYPAVILAIALVGYGTYTSLVDPGPWVYNSNFRTGESLIIQAMSAYSLLRISKEEDVQLLRHPTFWISSGFFIYFSVNMVVFLSASFLSGPNSFLFKNTWFIHSIINIIANIIFTFGLLCIPPPRSR